jgi:hypothetical protein
MSGDEPAELQLHSMVAKIQSSMLGLDGTSA